MEARSTSSEMDLKAIQGGKITDLKINSMLRVRLKIESRMDLASSVVNWVDFLIPSGWQSIWYRTDIKCL